MEAVSHVRKGWTKNCAYSGFVGGYPYLDPTFGARQPGMNDRDTRVEIRKL